MTAPIKGNAHPVLAFMAGVWEDAGGRHRLVEMLEEDGRFFKTYTLAMLKMASPPQLPQHHVGDEVEIRIHPALDHSPLDDE